MARLPTRQRINRNRQLVAISAFYAMYIAIRWWMMSTFLLCCSIESRKLRKKHLKCYNKRRENMMKMFSESDVTSEVNMRRSSIDMDNSEFIEEAIQDAYGSEGSTRSVTSKRKRSKTTDFDEIYLDFYNDVKEALVKFKEIVVEYSNANMKENMEARDMYVKVLEEIKALPEIDVIQRFKAADMIGKDMMSARTFLTLNPEDKISMVKVFADWSIA